MSSPLSRDAAWTLLTEWIASPGLRRHCLAVAASMRAMARVQGADEELWEVTGMLHDLDYERFPDLETGHPRHVMALLEERDAPPEMVHAIAAHASYLGVPAQTPLDRALLAVDELSGFVLACAYVRPEGIHGMTPKSVKKKLKTPAFAAAVSREEVAHGAELAGMEFDELIRLVIGALEAEADALELHGRGAEPAPAGAAPEQASAVSGFGRYGRILRARYVLALSITALVARLPIGVVSLAIVLFLRAETGSYAVAGAVAAAFALGSGGAAPVAGRLVDRLGGTRVLVPLAVVNAAALLALVWLGLNAAPTAALLVVGLVAGACVPPTSAVLRTLWPGLLGDDRDELLPTAFALDSVIIELVFTLGPLLAAGVSAFASPQAALVLSALLTVAGTAAFMALPPTRAAMPDPPMPDGGRERTRNRLGALAAPGLRTIVLATLPIGFTFGATEVTLPAFAEDMGSPELGGVGIAVWSAASAVGGLIYGARPGSLRLDERFVRLASFLALAFLPLALAPNFLLMLPLLVVAGAFIAPSLAAGNQLAGDVAPAGTETEAFTWPVTSLVVGVALGNAAAGAVVEYADWRTSFVCATAGAIAGALVLRVRRSSLVPPQVGLAPAGA